MKMRKRDEGTGMMTVCRARGTLHSLEGFGSGQVASAGGLVGGPGRGDLEAPACVSSKHCPVMDYLGGHSCRTFVGAHPLEDPQHNRAGCFCAQWFLPVLTTLDGFRLASLALR